MSRENNYIIMGGCYSGVYWDEDGRICAVDNRMVCIRGKKSSDDEEEMKERYAKENT